MYIPRLAEQKLRELLQTGKIVIVLGARQVGKTTLLEKIASGSNPVFFNLDLEVDKARFASIGALAPGDVVKNLGNPKYLIIDEAHRIKNEKSRCFE